MRTILRAACLLALLCTIGLPTQVRAQGDQDPDGHVEGLIEEATNAYDTLEIKKAQSILSKAIDYAADHGVSPSVHARTYILMGVVKFAETRDKQIAREHFIQALELDRNVTVPDVYKTPTLTTLLSEAKERADLAPPADDTGTETASKPPPETFQHTPVTTANAGKPVELTVRVPTSLTPDKIRVYARRYDQQEYWTVPMSEETATTWRATIKGARVYTSQLDYYIEATDSEGTVIANSGSAAAPHSITILGSASYTPPKASAGGSGSDGGAGPTGPSGPPRDTDTDRGRNYAFIQATAGTAAGLIFNGNPTANPDRDVRSGLAPAFGHVRLDIGGLITERTHLGLFFRWQYSPAQQFAGLDHLDRSGFPTTEAQCLGIGIIGDCQLGLAVRHFLSTSPGLRIFATGGLGVGRVREWLRLKEPASNDFCDSRRTFSSGGEAFCYRRDTIRPGWFHVGGGGGLEWPVNNQFSLIAEGYLQVLVPTTALHLDISVGPRLEF